MWDSLPKIKSNEFSSAVTYPTISRQQENQEIAEALFWKEALRKPTRKGNLPRVGSPEWFDKAEKLRYSHYGKWVPKLLEFNKHTGEKILCIGTGLGTDWIQYAKNGAEVWAVPSKDAPVELIRLNFQTKSLDCKLRKLSGQGIPFAASSFDVIFLNDFCKDEITSDYLALEIQRILKPGGKLLSLSPALYNLKYFIGKLFPINHSNNETQTYYSASELKTLFKFCQESRVQKRHLQRNDLPPLFRWIPIPLIERMVGTQLIFKGFKPLCQAIAVLQAA